MRMVMKDRRKTIVRLQQMMNTFIRILVFLICDICSVQLLLLKYFCSKMRYKSTAVMVKTPDNREPILAVMPHQCCCFMLRLPVKTDNSGAGDNSDSCQCGKLPWASASFPQFTWRNNREKCGQPGSNSLEKTEGCLKLFGSLSGEEGRGSPRLVEQISWRSGPQPRLPIIIIDSPHATPARTFSGYDPDISIFKNFLVIFICSQNWKTLNKEERKSQSCPTLCNPMDCT